jgi:hypothetical protein
MFFLGHAGSVNNFEEEPAWQELIWKLFSAWVIIIALGRFFFARFLP